MNSNLIASLIITCIACHPLVYICFNREYRCSRRSPTLYYKCDLVSALATAPHYISLSICLFSLGILVPSLMPLCGLPIVLGTWTLFIRDRFRSLSRGMGAPGYFSFFSITSLYFATVAQLPGLFIPCSIALTFLLVELAFIFTSAGIFKFIDAHNQLSGFTIGLLNPAWSKISKQVSILLKLRWFNDNLGPLLQVLAGLAIILLPVSLKPLGLMIIVFMFIAITPFLRLAWLCLSIAGTAFVFYIYYPGLLEWLSTSSGKISFLIASTLRLLVMLHIFVEYFANYKLFLSILNPLARAYKTLLGSIIWKVFTYDLVRYFIVNARYLSNFNNVSLQEEPSCGATLILPRFLGYASLSNVYDSITIASLICSRSYVSSDIFMARITKILNVYGATSLIYFDLGDTPVISPSLIKNNALRCIEISPHSQFRDMSSEEIDNIISAQNLISYSSKN